MSVSSSRKQFLEQYITKTEFMTIGKKTTVCCATIYNGHEVVATSACVDPKNFNKELGQTLAYERALEEVSKLFGFLEQDREYVFNKNQEKDE